MFKTIRADYYFIVPASIIWAAGIGVTVGDFLLLQQALLRLGPINLLGLALMTAGIAVRRRAKRELSRYFAPGLRVLSDHQLISVGPYARVRHPAYLGNLLFWFGAPLLVSSVYGFLVMLLLTPCYLYRMRIEEGMLIERFGSEYLEYIKRTQRLIPYIY